LVLVSLYCLQQNTPKGADEKLEEWDTKKRLGVYEWSVFYEEKSGHDTSMLRGRKRMYGEG